MGSRPPTAPTSGSRTSRQPSGRCLPGVLRASCPCGEIRLHLRPGLLARTCASVTCMELRCVLARPASCWCVKFVTVSCCCASLDATVEPGVVGTMAASLLCTCGTPLVGTCLAGVSSAKLTAYVLCIDTTLTLLNPQCVLLTTGMAPTPQTTGRFRSVAGALAVCLRDAARISLAPSHLGLPTTPLSAATPQTFGGGNLDNCNPSNMWCYVCEVRR